jgi:hypothetical protein
LREIHTVAARIGPIPSADALGLRRRAREVPVDREESDRYPAGGFDALSTKGSFENLVRSEVVYVGEGAVARGGIDLFDVRFVESELLFYTRDESPLLDARRDVTIVIDRPAEQRFKQASLFAQTLVLVEGLALALEADLVRVFGPAGSHTRIVFHAPTVDDRAAANEEQLLMAFTLAAEIAHRRVEIATVASIAEIQGGARVVFSTRPEDRSQLCVAWIRVGEAQWRDENESIDVREGAPALRSFANALLVRIAAGGTREIRTT